MTVTHAGTADRSAVTSLPVVETFHSLQGEGLHAGRSAFFLRLAGCTVGCPWCDTKHSWPAGVHPEPPPSGKLSPVLLTMRGLKEMTSAALQRGCQS
jgi:organic radical activating enzyme